jgi:hypothetical protein
MGWHQPFKRLGSTAPVRRAAMAVALVVFIGGAAFAGVAIGHAAPRTHTNRAHTDHRVSARAAATTASTASDSGLANLPDRKARMSCAALAKTTKINGLALQVTKYQTGTAAKGDPEYCALTGHIAKYIGFEVLLPMKTWHERYLQVGCGGLCGSIGLSAPQSTGFKALSKGYFVVASQDEGHSGMATTWSSNGTQRVDFAYLSDHDLLLAVKGLTQKFYGLAPEYSYFDGCSQGGHQALTEAQRYPKDFNGILAGAPAAIMTELNSVLHEYEYKAVQTSAGQPVLSETEAQVVLDAAIKKCDPGVGLILDTAGCEKKFDVSSTECTATKTTNCLTAAQVAAVEKVLVGPVDAAGQKLYVGGYSLASLDLWDNSTGPNIPATDGGTVTPGTFITAWLQYFALEKNLGDSAVADEPFTKAYFEKLEKYAPFWDDTNPYLQPFEKAGGKLILWQGGGDWSIPTDSSVAYYQALVKAVGGLKTADTFSRYYQLPQVGHCGGQGPDTYAGLASVVRWTETGKAPGALTATEYASSATSTGGAPSGTTVGNSPTGTGTGTGTTPLPSTGTGTTPLPSTGTGTTPLPSTGTTTTGGGPGGSGGPGGAAASTSDLTDDIPALGASSATKATRSIELYPYPELPSYKGTGNVNAASSYVGKVSAALEAPLPWLGSFNNTMIWCNASGTVCEKRAMPTS